MALTIQWNPDGTVTVRCGQDSVTIGAPAGGGAAVPPPAPAPGGVIMHLSAPQARPGRLAMWVGAQDDPAMLLRAIDEQAAREVLLMFPKGASGPFAVSEIQDAARSVFGDGVTLFFVREAGDG